MRKVGFAALTVAFLLFLTVLPVTGTTWESHVNVTNDAQSQHHVSLFVDSDGHAHIAWSNTTAFIGIQGITGYIFYSNNTGGSFGMPVLIPAPVNGSWGPSLAVDAFGNAHIAFFGGNVTPSDGGVQTKFADVFYSTNKGSVDGSFQTIKLTDYSPAGSTSLWPDLALDSNGYAHIVWRDNVGDIRYGNNTSGAFGDEKVTNLNGVPILDSPSIALDDSDGVHVAYNDRGSPEKEIYYTTKIGAVGAGWTTPLNVANDPDISASPDDLDPDISVDDGLIHIAWQRYNATYSRIYYTNGSINGFPALTEVSSGQSDSQASLALDSLGNAHIAWRDASTWPFSIRYTNNTGGSFGTSEDLSFAHGHHYSPSVFIDDDDFIHVSFAGYNTTSGPLDVFYLKSGEPVIPPAVSEFVGQLLPLLILASFTTLIIGIRYAKKKTLN